MRLLIAALTVIALIGCRADARPVASRSPAPRAPDTAAAGQGSSRASASGSAASADCIPNGTQVALNGPLEREVHLGPPGYGESPREDARDTITVIVLGRELVLCAGAFGPADTAHARARRIQIMGIGPSVNARLGFEAMVYGRVEQATFGFHFTPIVIQLDSVVAPGPRRAAGRV